MGAHFQACTFKKPCLLEPQRLLQKYVRMAHAASTPACALSHAWPLHGTHSMKGGTQLNSALRAPFLEDRIDVASTLRLLQLLALYASVKLLSQSRLWLLPLCFSKAITATFHLETFKPCPDPCPRTQPFPNAAVGGTGGRAWA